MKHSHGIEKMSENPGAKQKKRIEFILIANNETL